MYTGNHARDWEDAAMHGAAVVQRVEAGLAWEQDAERGRADQDGWLLSFIDVLTLLLTLFVLLLAYQHGAGQRADAVTVPATAQPVVETAATTEPATPVAEAVMQPDAPSESATGPDGIGSIDTANSTAIATAADYLTLPELWETDWMAPLLAQVARARMTDHPAAAEEHSEPQSVADAPADPVERLLAGLNEPGLQGRVEVMRQPGGVNLEISDSILFTPASAALTEGGQALLEELAAILAGLPYELSVEGHTDDRPIATERFPSNWELASARASRVTRSLIEEGIPAERVRAIGYADTRPRADNATVDGRARNRRVSFILRMPAS